MSSKDEFTQIPFPKNRELVIDVVELGYLKHHIPGFIDFDVTLARQFLKNMKNTTGHGFSFTGWLAKCIGQAVSEHKQMHALRQGRRSMIIFNDVDILVMVEKQVGEEIISRPIIIRKVNEKTVQQIHDEIRTAQSQPIGHDSLMIGSNPWFGRFYPSLPKFFRILLGRKIISDPFQMKKLVGTVEITSVGMTDNFNGCMIPVSPQPLLFAIGGISMRPVVIAEKVENREFLSVIYAFDHDVIDGAPVARFISRLSELIESGFGLNANEDVVKNPS